MAFEYYMILDKFCIVQKINNFNFNIKRLGEDLLTSKKTLLLFVLFVNVLMPLNVYAQTQNWSTPDYISESGSISSDPTIRVSSDGTKATAVWLGTSSNFIIQTASATINENVASWSSVTDLSAIGGDAAVPKIALSADGTKATAVWIRHDGSYNIVQAASATISGSVASWSSVSDLSTSGSDSTNPQIALSSDGTKATAIWKRGQIIQAASASINGSSASWSSATDISLPGEDALRPKIAISSNGTKAIAVWYRFDMGQGVIQSAVASISGNTATWSSVTDLTTNEHDSVGPEIAISADGTTAITVWRRDHGSALYVIETASATISANMANWGNTTFLSAEGGLAQENQVRLSEDGTNATIIWNRQLGSKYIIRSKSGVIRGNSSRWGPTTALSAYGQDAGSPDLALSLDGTRAIAIWRRSNGTNTIIQSKTASINDSCASWGSPKNISAAGQDGNIPKISASSNAESATAVWQHQISLFLSDRIISSSATISFPTPIPTSSPSATPSQTPLPKTIPHGSVSRNTPRPKAWVCHGIINISLRASIDNIKHTYVTLINTTDETIYTRKRVTVSNGTGKIAIKKVPAGIYRLYTVITRVGQAPVHSKPRLVKVN